MRLSDEEQAIQAGELGEPRRFALEHLAASLGSYGATPLFHLAGVTPEAPDLEAALAGLTLADAFEVDITEAVKTGDRLEVDPESGTVRILERAAP